MDSSSISNNHFILKVSRRLCPSSFTSCQFRTLIDVAESSASKSDKRAATRHEHDLSCSSFCNKSPNCGDLGRYSKCPNDGRGEKLLLQSRKSFSSNSNTGLFSSSSEERAARIEDVGSDAFFSLSSNSGGDSFRLVAKPGQGFSGELKRIDGIRSSSFSSVNSSNAVGRKIAAPGAGKAPVMKTGQSFPRQELIIKNSDHISTELYYGADPDVKLRRRRNVMKGRRKTGRAVSRRGFDRNPVIGESYAVEKRTQDPRGDFRASMVEMIVEKKIFGTKELERLLLCLLSLNSASYHGMIIEVFTEICETLFSN